VRRNPLRESFNRPDFFIFETEGDPNPESLRGSRGWFPAPKRALPEVPTFFSANDNSSSSLTQLAPQDQLAEACRVRGRGRRN
jgi:hypothetical protein